VLKRLLEERKMPLTITREMMEKDPFFQEGQERERRRIVISLYKKGKSPEEIAELLDLSIKEVKSLLNGNSN
jgi:DNA-binding CsgD family transcriptional regulator